ncbi:hypothetical protein Q765_03800 [Flavobacterium rivuli WB 3.3-2 = DSM 21788]|uniref:Adenylosuccinate lyase n=1 Tax=Flavobacterium rivuli WB 3.3-2 = DSM 21788 TaxID=1121895 RepID=A0A0A2M994_9FLAO|nr:hypothetical protein [Flavobacterium rivuli]KGO88176.1 hypothetical protein Q765_03800 [Flavobacterium rivuli WB 3.3-2 = DSM 21788]
METNFYKQIAKSTAHRSIRDLLSGAVLQDKNLLGELVNIALNIKDPNHHKACWILELVMEAKIDWLADYLTEFCSTLNQINHEGALRSVSKICMFAVKHRQKHTGFLSTAQVEQITEACFDWLIDPDGKVATKAYAMGTLHLLGKENDWIYPELRRILSEDASKHSTAYIAAAKDILKKIGT